MGQTSVRWTTFTGQEDTPTKEVEGTYPNPCAALKAIHDRAEQFAFKEQLAFEVERLRAECDHWRAKQMAPPAPPSPEPAAQPAPPSEPPVAASSIDDSPEAQSAPASPASESVQITTEPAPSSYTAIAPQVFAPAPHNMPTEWVPQLVEPPEGAWGTDEDWLTQMLRGQPEPAKRRWSHADPPPGQPVRKGDPVDLSSGLFSIVTTDLDVPTPFLPLQLRRCYLSGLPFFGPWGFNWDHNYNQHLRELSDGGVAVWTGRLHEVHFSFTDGTLAPEPGVHQRLSSPAPGSYLLVMRGGVSLRFERPPGWHDPQRIPLVEIADRHGNRQLLSYDTLDRLDRVAEHPRDAGGPPSRWMEFAYGNCGLLEGLLDHTGRQVHYDHHPEVEHLARVTLPAIGGYPKGVCTEYHYDEEAEHPAVQHNIVGIVDADERLYLENEYAGPDELWAFNRVVRQRVGDDFFEFGYEQLQYVPRRTEYKNLPAARTTYRPPDGALHTYTFNYRGDLLDHRFRLNRDGSARVIAWQFEYDDQGNTTSVIDPAGRTTALTYEYENADPCARGNLREVTLLPALPYLDNPRVVMQVYYDPTFQLPIRIIDAINSETRLRYDFDDGVPAASGRLTAVQRPTVALPTGETQTAHITVSINDQGLLTHVESPTGVRHELSHRSAPWEGLVHQLRLDVHEADLATTFDYDPVGFVARITDSFGAATAMTANASGSVEHVVLPEVNGVPAQLRFGYSPDGTLVRREVPRGEYQDQVITGPDLIDEIHLDLLGRPAEQVIGANTAQPRQTRRCHDHAGNVVHLVDPAGCHTRNTFDERGRLLEQSVGDEPVLTTHFTYELDGRLRRILFPDGSKRTVEQRDVWGRATHVREATGALRQLKWSPSDRVLESTIVGDPGDGSNRVLARFRYEYDARDRLVHEHASVFEQDPADAVELTTTYHYDADDRLRRVVTPTAEMRWEYDGLPRVTRYADPVGNATRVTRHSNARIIELSHDELEPGGTRISTWQFTADERMRLRRIVFPGGEAIDTVVDDRDLPIEQHEPLGVVRRLRYGLLGEVEQMIVDPGGLAIINHYHHDAMGRLVGFVDAAGAVTTWQRDLNGRPTTIKTADGGVWRMTYGVSGLLLRQLPSGTRQMFEYLPGKRLHAIECQPAAALQAVPRHEYGYDGLGRLVRAVAGQSTVERHFDSLGRLIGETSAGREIRLHHDDLAGRIDLRYPDGRVEQTMLDAAGRPIAVKLLQAGGLGGLPGADLVKLSYAGAHRLYTVHFANGVESVYAYDAARRLVAVDLRRGTELVESFRYWYDARHRRRLVEATGPPALQRLHTFDTADRLVATASGFVLPAPLSGAWTQTMHDQRIAAAEVAYASATEAYGLSPADDRTSAGAVPFTHAAGHRLTSVGAEQVTHTADGTRAADGSFDYDVDAFGRITAIRDASTGAVKAKYDYDALSRAAKGLLNGVDFQRWYLGNDWIQQELFGGTVQQRTMHPWSPMPLLRHDPGGTLTLAGDGLLNTTAVFDGDGGLLERHRFDAFGLPTRYTPAGQPAPPGTDPLFGGMPWIESLGLYETPLRLYHPRHGQFLAPDPHGYADSPNLYAFAAHNPVDFADPTGADKRPRFSEQRVEQMWHATWDSYLEFSFDLPFHAASWTARLSPQGLVAWALGYDLGEPTEWVTTTHPLKFGRPANPVLGLSYDEHRFGSTVFFNALAGVGLGVASGPRVVAEGTLPYSPMRGSAGAALARDTTIFTPPGEFVLLQRGGKHLEALEAQAWWSRHPPRYAGNNVMLWEYRSGGIMFDYAKVDRFGELETLMEFKWDYTGSINSGNQAVAIELRSQAAAQASRADELGVGLQWHVPDTQLKYFQDVLGPELSSQIEWVTYDLAEARTAFGL